MANLLLDTSILVDYLHNKPAAVAYVEATAAQQLLSAVVVAELYVACATGPSALNLMRW